MNYNLTVHTSERLRIGCWTVVCGDFKKERVYSDYSVQL